MAGLLDLLRGGQQQTAQAPQAEAMPNQRGSGLDFLRNLAPAIAMLDPRNQQLGMGLMAMNSDRKKQAQDQQNQNVTAAWLQKNGVGREEASFLASNHDALNAWYKDYKTGNQPDWQFQTVYDDQGREQKAMVDMKTGKFNVVGGPKGGHDGGGDEYGLNPQYGVDDQGNPVLVQVGKSGTAVKTKMPDGVTLSKQPIKLDAGDHFVLLDPITRQPVGTVAKNLAEAENQKAIGKAQGEAAFDLPRVEQNAEQTLGILERMKTHPGREGSTGFIQGLLPSRNSDQVDFQSLVDQTQGQSFLQAFQMLKGGGQITEVEGQRATDAISRLRNQRLGDNDYLKAITDLEDVIRNGLARARQQAGQVGARDGAAPAAGNDYKSKYGLD